MKNAYKFSVVIVIAVLYYFSTYILTVSPIVVNIQNEQGSEKGELIEHMFDNVVSNFLMSDNTNNFSQVVASSLKKNQSVTNFSLNEVIDNSIQSEFLQYIYFSRNFLINFRKADLIFPFNYFW